MSEWITDGYIVVQGHGQQDAWCYTLKCVKSHIWSRQESKYISGTWNQKIPSILGTILVRSTISVTPSMPGKMYLGSWSLGSHLMMIRSKAFLIVAVRYRTRNGIPIQHCTDSRPGIPIGVNTEGMKTMLLEIGSVLGSPDTNKETFLCQCYSLFYFLFSSKVIVLSVYDFGRAQNTSSTSFIYRRLKKDP